MTGSCEKLLLLESDTIFFNEKIFQLCTKTL